MIPPRLWPTAATTLARTFGLRGLAFRSAHELRRASGRFLAAPRHLPTDDGRDDASFKVDPGALAAATNRDEALTRARAVAGGQFEAFRFAWRSLPRTAAEWHTNPLTGHRYASDVAWWHVPHLDPAAGDIKDVWEPGRFAWAYDLVRGHLLTRDPAYATAFADAFAEWDRANPPFRGVHWSCGQETAIRAVALLYAETNLDGLDDQVRRRLATVLAASGERIADAFGYAISQRNNHAISEAVGLVVLGIRFRGSHPHASRWLRRGQRWLEKLIVEQFAEDGWYIQHSFTYLRLALDQCIVAERALRAIGAGLPEPVLGRLRAAVELLLAVMDGDTGVVPNHGANDGATVHPVTLAAYRDFRPVVTAAAAMFGVPLPADVPPDAEVLSWLGIGDVTSVPARGSFVHTGSSGWAAVRQDGWAVFLRAGSYRARPGHLDPLQLDIRFAGREVIVDAGTYAYNAAPPWRNALMSARVHNGPLLDDREPGIRGPRFLWYAWPSAELRSASREADGRVRLVAQVPGSVRRTVEVRRDSVTVLDEVLDAAGAARVVVRWLLHPSVGPGVVSCDPPPTVRDAVEGSPLAWFSPRYGERLPSHVVEVSSDALREAKAFMNIDRRSLS
jgi:hypothetical protein